MYESLIDKLVNENQASERIEKKIAINSGNSNLIRRILSSLNFYPLFDDRLISSIYFDTADLTFLRDNINGVSNRIKFRSRYYNDVITKPKLEVKLKKSFLGYKAFLDSDGSSFNIKNFIAKSASIINANYPFEPLYPTAFVSYKRMYFQNHLGIRCTVDQDLVTHKIVGAVDLQELLRIRTIGMFDVVEFKFNKVHELVFRNDIFKHFVALPIRATKCSKYVRTFTDTF